MTTTAEIVNMMAAANTAIGLHPPINYVQLDPAIKVEALSVRYTHRHLGCRV
jgi:hypothetical protein